MFQTLSILLFSFAPALDAPSLQEERIPVASAEELPTRSYELAKPIAELIADDEAFAALGRALFEELETLFETHDVTDVPLRRELLRATFHAAIAAERWPEAERYLKAARALEERADMRLVAGLHWDGWIAAQRARASSAAQDFDVRAAFAQGMRDALEGLDWKLVHRELERRRGRMGILGAGLLEQALASVLGSAADGGPVPSATVREMLPLANGARILLPHKQVVADAYGVFLDANRVELADIWRDRVVVLSNGEDLTPVRIAVWDTGVDVAVFPDQLWTNPAERLDGRDEDGNGFVDDVHGVAFDADLRPTTALLADPDPDEEVWKRARSFSRGLSDLGAAIDSPQARRLQRKLERLAEDEVQPFLGELMHYAHYTHGTHVAGIALEGNPFAELVVARVGLDHRVPGDPMTFGWAHRFAAMCHETVDYFRAQGVRVVNMSWAFGIAEIEENLRDTGAPGSPLEVRARAEAIHAIVAGGIEAALASAPEILFVCGAGNSGSDSSLDRFTPSCSSLPNLVTVGGVDRAGGMTAFTSYGDHVRLYANGFLVESTVPGGERVPMSGTSMSAPQAANLAGKLLAVDPSLTPEELIELLFAGADATAFAGAEVFLMNARASVELARRGVRGRSEEAAAER